MAVVSTVEAQREPNGGVVLRSETIGRNLDRFVAQLLGETTTRRREFSDLKREVNQVFFSIPSVMRLIAVEGSLSALVEQAKAQKDFQIQLSVDSGQRSSSTNSDGTIGTQAVTASRPVYDFGAAELGIERAQAQKRESLADISEQRSRALLELILVRLDLNVASQKLGLAQAFYDTRKDFADYIAEKQALGVSSKAELIRAQAKLFEAEARLPIAFSELTEAREKFFELYGYEAPEGIKFDQPNFDPLRAAEGEIIDMHPLVQLAESRLNAARLELEQFSAGDSGAFIFEVTAARVDSPNSDAVSRLDGQITYNRTLGDGGSRDAQKRLLKAGVEEFQSAVEQTRRERLRSIRTAKLSLATAESSRAGQLRVLKATREANSATKELFMFNRGNLSDVFRVQEDFLGVAEDVVSAEASVETAYYELLHETGSLLRQFELSI